MIKQALSCEHLFNNADDLVRGRMKVLFEQLRTGLRRFFTTSIHKRHMLLMGLFADRDVHNLKPKISISEIVKTLEGSNRYLAPGREIQGLVKGPVHVPPLRRRGVVHLKH